MLKRIDDRAVIEQLVEKIWVKNDPRQSVKFRRVRDKGYLSLFLLGRGGEELIEFTVWRGKNTSARNPVGEQGRPSAGFATDGKQTWLVHSGRVHFSKNAFNPARADVNIQGSVKKYHIVSDVDADSVLLNAALFHLSRFDADLGVVDDIKTDDGPSSPFFSRECRKDPKHFKIVRALRDQLKTMDFKGWRHGAHVRCDCVAQKGKSNFIFEVKTSSSLRDVSCAIGQLLLYRKFINQDAYLVLVSPDDIVGVMISFLDELGVYHWPIYRRDAVVFLNPPPVLLN